MSQPTVSKAKTSYPLFSATWANSKPSYLIVGGGGGAGRHGVKNKISVFDFSERAPNVESCAEIEASEHDSVTCLANLGTKDGCVLLAGINDSEEERLAGKNECLKGFEVRFPKKAEGKGEISFLSKTALFTPPISTVAKKEGQTASSSPNKRIGAVASSLAVHENEIVVFSATSNKPENPEDVIQRIALHKGQEANDLDILDQGNGKFQVAYCLDNDVYVQKIIYDFDKRRSLCKADADRTHAYTVPLPDINEKKGRSKIRSGSIILRKKFDRHVLAAVDMDVALLNADEDGAYQAVVAVAAIDVSLTVLTINYRGRNLNTISKFNNFATYYNVHELQMTKVVLSPFIKPESSQGKRLGPQYLRLATTSLGNSIDVETFELYLSSNKLDSCYVLQSARSKAIADTAKYLVIAMIVAAFALMVQGLLNTEDSMTRSLIYSMRDIPESAKVPAANLVADVKSAANINNDDSPVAKAQHRLRDLLHLHIHSVTAPEHESNLAQKALVVHHDPDTDGTLSTEVHEGEYDVVKKHTEAKKWEELDKHEQRRWKEKLADAGMWTIEEGETILKGVFFSEAGALVGRVAAGVIG
ncbi:uncharacterized protein N0V89_008323 [Didymosphaeria variabile]|uniref:Guanine nucleotide-exchange factor SEC12 n=1 Tax=Didymosphaeria variabile TaxID=1932322 RepID=A0A9W8XFI8_9PLEO|nr:uncharacterized protein N0V89_008323 [Didymosphaeria variabile]KAJ4349706.1 hypothetical protein N0V89_008323 [Didymosphaeria variabile]